MVVVRGDFLNRFRCGERLRLVVTKPHLLSDAIQHLYAKGQANRGEYTRNPCSLISVHPLNSSKMTECGPELRHAAAVLTIYHHRHLLDEPL